jgi:hypothetical protein
MYLTYNSVCICIYICCSLQFVFYHLPMMIYFNYTYDLCVSCTPWRWAKHTDLTSMLELVVPIVQEAGIRSLDHSFHSKLDCKVSLGLRSVWVCRRSWPTISLGSRWLLASSWSCLPVSPGQNGPPARTVAHEGHVSAACDAESDNTNVTLQIPALSTISYSYILSWA